MFTISTKTRAAIIGAVQQALDACELLADDVARFGDERRLADGQPRDKPLPRRKGARRSSVGRRPRLGPQPKDESA